MLAQVATSKSVIYSEYRVSLCEANAYALWSTGRQDLTLKPKQEEGAILHLHDGRDVFARFPTGYGKSLC